MKIAHFITSDQQVVAHFWSKIFKELGWIINDQDGFDNIAAFFHLPKGIFLIVKNGEGKIVGCGGVRPFQNEMGIIKRFYIIASLRGTGLAKELLDKIIEESKNKGYTQLVLDVFYTNIRAEKFYEKHGFIKYNQEPNQLWRESLSPDKFSYYKLII
jgi:ribosomal protein S18 acetylase RimI-like enzyme